MTHAGEERETRPRRRAEHRAAGTPLKGLGGRAVRAGGWVLGMRTASSVLTMARTVVVARVLAPDDIGLFGIALLVLALLETVMAPAFGDAFLRRRSRDPELMHAAWSMQLVTAAVLAVAVFFAAPGAARLLGEPAATPLIRALTVAVFVRRLVNVGIYRYQRQLDFSKRFQMELAAAMVDFGVAAATVLATGSVWALVAGVIAGRVAYVGASYALDPVWPRFVLRRELLARLRRRRPMFRIVGLSRLAVAHVPGIVVARALGPASLGVYQVAHRLSVAVTSDLVDALGRVAVPAVARMGDDLARVRAAWVQALKVGTLVAFPVAAVLFAIAPLVIDSLLGPNWRDAAPLLRALAVWSALHVLDLVDVALLRGRGRTGLAVISYVAQVVLLVPAMIAGSTRGGLPGAVYAAVALAAPFAVIRFALALRAVGGGASEPVKTVSVPALVALAGASVAFAVASLLQDARAEVAFAAAVVSAASISGGILLALERFAGYPFLAWIRENATAARRPPHAEPADADDED